MPIFQREHGGLCCGIGHLRGFTPGRYTRESILADITWPAGNDRRVAEVTLIDSQLRYPGLAAALREAGFVPVSRFYNSNSTNTVTVFHHHPDGVAFDIADIPNWDEAYNPPVPQVMPARAPVVPAVPGVPHGLNVGDLVRVINVGRHPGEPLRGGRAIFGIDRDQEHTVTAVDGATIMVSGAAQPQWYAAWRFERLAPPNPAAEIPIAPVDAHPPVARADQPALGTECTIENTRVGDRVHFTDYNIFQHPASIVTVTSMTNQYIRHSGMAGGFRPHNYTHAPLPVVQAAPEPAVRTYANVYPRTGRSDIHWPSIERCQEAYNNRIRLGLTAAIRIDCIETNETVHVYRGN